MKNFGCAKQIIDIFEAIETVKVIEKNQKLKVQNSKTETTFRQK